MYTLEISLVTRIVIEKRSNSSLAWFITGAKICTDFGDQDLSAALISGLLSVNRIIPEKVAEIFIIN